MATETRLATGRSKRVTLADVAAAAGVSVATASVAITGRPSGNCRVSSAVAERIRHAARELRYRPNLQARNLSTQRTRTIAFLIKRADWHNAMLYFSAAQRVLRQRGYFEAVMLHPNDVESERNHLELCIERQVEGILAMPLIDLDGRSNVETFNRIHRDEGIPVVQLGLALDGCVAPSITTDEVGGIADAVTLLHAMGHRRIAMATHRGYDDASPLNPFCIAHLRYLGYRRRMRELGLAERVFATREKCRSVEMLYDTALPLGAEIASAGEVPTALVAYSAFTAAGVICGLVDAGLSLPRDMSVIGVGDQPFARMVRPALATLVPPLEQQGELATATLLRMVEGAQGDSAALLPELIARASLAPPRAS